MVTKNCYWKSIENLQAKEHMLLGKDLAQFFCSSGLKKLASFVKNIQYRCFECFEFFLLVVKCAAQN